MTPSEMAENNRNSDITNNDIPYIDPKIQTQDVMVLNYHLRQYYSF